jgi:D-alanine-D-alanine ligase
VIRVILIFGGRSAEHEVSILSARSVANAAPRERLEIVPICIARDGRFVSPDRSARILAGEKKGAMGDLNFSFETWARSAAIDIVFPLVHGTGGEDGSLQGYLEMLGLPYVGSGVTASAVGMDKVHMKQAFAAAKLPMVEYVAVLEHEWKHERERVSRAIANSLRLPFFIKPANSGSSVGVTKVKNDADLGKAIEHALRFDEKVLVERGVEAREIEVAVLGNEKPQASVAGEIVAGAEFYDYADKYVETKSHSVIPAKLATDKSEEIRKLALAAFKAVGASGFSRVDFFLERGTNRIYLNEINTIPGFTSISMYPKLWEATELKYPRLIEKLVALGIERGKMRAARGESTMKWFDEVAPLT